MVHDVDLLLGLFVKLSVTHELLLFYEGGFIWELQSWPEFRSKLACGRPVTFTLHCMRTLLSLNGWSGILHALTQVHSLTLPGMKLYSTVDPNLLYIIYSNFLLIVSTYYTLEEDGEE